MSDVFGNLEVDTEFDGCSSRKSTLACSCELVATSLVNQFSTLSSVDPKASS